MGARQDSGDCITMAIDTNVPGTVRPSRRSVVRGAAWSVPVVSMAATAPAFAASCGSTDVAYTLDWGNNALTTYVAPSNPSGTGTKIGTATVLAPAGSGGSSLIVTFSSVTAGSMVRATDNLSVSSETNVGGLGLGRGLNIAHADPIPAGYNNRQDISISFSRAVTNLRFTITDIDATQGNWVDQVAVSGARNGVPVSTVAGSGTVNDPWMPTTYGNRGNNSNQGNVTVTFPSVAANTPFVFSFWNMSGDGNQRVFLSDFTFTAKGC